MHDIKSTLDTLISAGNYRSIPDDTTGSDIIDLSSNDYLGLGSDIGLRQEFISTLTPESFVPSSSASRLLSAHQNSYTRLESLLSQLYGHPALLFNSGYHANTGLVSALASRSTLFIADRLVHASIIDGLKLGGAPFERYRHNDYDHLERIIQRLGNKYSRIVIISESVFSMDGDCADIDRLISAKRLHPDTLLYIDEAHAVGVCGPSGLGYTAGCSRPAEVDILVGTFGKALASAGAFAILSDTLRQYMVNRARSLIFSTSLPPVITDWTYTTLTRSLDMDERRQKLCTLAATLANILSPHSTSGHRAASHIQPLIIGDAAATVDMSARLLQAGYKVLPIRTPTVPPGTERLRFSLSAALEPRALQNLEHTILESVCS